MNCDRCMRRAEHLYTCHICGQNVCSKCFLFNLTACTKCVSPSSKL